MLDGNAKQISVESQQALASTLGVNGPTTGEQLTVGGLREQLSAEADDEFVSMGEAIREDLSGRLDTELLTEELPKMAEQLAQIEQVRNAGVPVSETGPGFLYRELIEPGWRVYRHLEDVGFFESVEDSLPAFTPEHIAMTARELVQAEPLTGALSECGFDEREQMVLMMNVTNNNIRLSRWTPTREIPNGVEFNVEYVPPLQQRAMGGALLWINALDDHLWRKEILITDTILDDVAWDTKAMLGGLYLMAMAAHEIATSEERSLTNGQLTAALTASTAVQIVNQEGIMQNAFWITEEKRKPSKAAGREEELPWQ